MSTDNFFSKTESLVAGEDDHLLNYLYKLPQKNSDLMKFASLCAEAQQQVPGLGDEYIKNLGQLNKGVEHYDQILQLFAEVFAIDKILKMPWDENAKFLHEPKGTNGKSPDFRVINNGKAYNFEVKAPSLLKHQSERKRCNFQIPSRKPDNFKDMLSDALLPRDGPVLDFLKSADEKFDGHERSEGANILVILWDDFIYEPLGSLTDSNTGLLTENSYQKIDEKPLIYKNIDAVIVLRQLHVFQYALAEKPLGDDRCSMFDLSTNPYIPNIFIQTRWGNLSPEFILESFGALHNDDKFLENIAEYRNQDLVMWI